MQGTQVRSLVREDPTCRGATKPVRHNYWACALEPTRLEPVLCNKEATAMRSLHTATKSSPCLTQLEKAHTQQRGPNAAKKGRKEERKKKERLTFLGVRGNSSCLMAFKLGHWFNWPWDLNWSTGSSWVSSLTLAFGLELTPSALQVLWPSHSDWNFTIGLLVSSLLTPGLGTSQPP